MAQEINCPACGAPLDEGVRDHSVICAACGREIQPELVRNQFDAESNEIIDITAQPVPPEGLSGEENIDLGAPAAFYETNAAPSEAEVYTIPEPNQSVPGPGNVVLPPEKKKMTPLVIILLVIGGILLLTCLCIVLAISLFNVRTSSSLIPQFFLLT